MNKVIALIVLMAVYACKKDSVTTNKEKNNIAKSDTTKKRSIVINSCEDFIVNWSEIISFESELRRVLITDISNEKDLELLLKLLEDLKKTYPERYKTPSIKARVKVLETEIFMLKQSLEDENLKTLDEKAIRIQEAYNIFVAKIKAIILKEKDYEKYR